MGNRYTIKIKDSRPIKLTAMQNATYNFLKENKGSYSVEQIVYGLYKNCINGITPDVWTPEEKCDNVTHWCTALVRLNLISSEGDKFKFLKN